MDLVKGEIMTQIAYKYISENHSWKILTYEMKNLYDSICKDV